MRIALLAAFDAAIAEAETDEWNGEPMEEHQLRYRLGLELRDKGRDVCGQIEDGKFKNAAT